MLNRKSAFTLAEVMIVFTVIGVLTAILVPALFNASPDERILKAKKAYNTISRAVESLTNSGPYAINDGLLDSTPYIQGTEPADKNARLRFFCNNLAEALNIEKSDCTRDLVDDAVKSVTAACPTGSTFTTNDATRNTICIGQNTDANAALKYEELESNLDTACNKYYESVTADTYNLRTSDKILWGIQLTNFSHNGTLTSGGISIPAFYNVVCFDVANHTDPDYIYGLGVRKDGKIVIGAKLQEVLNKTNDEE